MAEETPSHNRDFYSWALAQASFLRCRSFDLLDTENIAREIEYLGRAKLIALSDALLVLTLHTLKWDHQSDQRSSGLVASIEAQRLKIADLLADNPGLKTLIAGVAERACRKGRYVLSKESGLDSDLFGASGQYDLDTLLTRDFALDR